MMHGLPNQKTAMEINPTIYNNEGKENIQGKNDSLRHPFGDEVEKKDHQRTKTAYGEDLDGNQITGAIDDNTASSHHGADEDEILISLSNAEEDRKIMECRSNHEGSKMIRQCGGEEARKDLDQHNTISKGGTE